MKIKAFQMNPEYTDSTNYMDFDGWEDFIIDGNKEFTSFHEDYPIYDSIQRHCIEYSDLFNELDDIADSQYKNATEAIEDYLGFKPTTKQVHDIKITLEKADKEYPYTDFDELTCDLLTICEKRTWICDTIYGCCQGDYQTVFYPTDSYHQEFIDYIESLYFNTGNEYFLEAVDDDDDTEEPNFDGDGYCDYFTEWNETDLKKHIADDSQYICGEHLNPDDVIIYEHITFTRDAWKAA